MAEHVANHAADAEQAHAPTDSRVYVRVAIILAAITAVEVIVSLLPGSGIVAMLWVVTLLLLSFAKGLLVVMYFMHLKFDSRWFTSLFVGGMVIATTLVITFLLLFAYKASQGT